MKPDGLKRLLDFLDHLGEKSIDFRLDQYSPDGITVTFALVGVRAEVEFTVDEMTYSLFRGDEGVEINPVPLYALIEEGSK